jgi:hypothetical protein
MATVYFQLGDDEKVVEAEPVDRQTRHIHDQNWITFWKLYFSHLLPLLECVVKVEVRLLVVQEVARWAA